MAETDPVAIVAPTTVNGTTTSQVPSKSEQSTTDEEHPKVATSASSAYPVFRFPSRLPRPPFIDVSGIPNFRCLGGYLSADGSNVVRPDLMYRCAHLTQITPEGLNHLTTSLNVKAIYDLRSGPEVARTSAGVIAAADAAAREKALLSPNNSLAESLPEIPSQSPLFQSLRQFTPVYATEDSGPEALARKLGWYSSSPSPLQSQLSYPFSEGFVNAYRDIATHGAPAYRAIFRHILNRPSDPFVFHCTAGKDRTGVFAALILRLSGVDDETICWEYAITEPGLGEWRTLFMARMSGTTHLHGGSSSSPSQTMSPPPTKSEMALKATGQTMSREEAARVCGSRAGNMRAWLTLVLDGEFGGAERYLAQMCGFTEGEITQIKRNLVVDLKELGEDKVVRPCPIEGWTADGGCQDV